MFKWTAKTTFCLELSLRLKRTGACFWINTELNPCCQNCNINTSHHNTFSLALPFFGAILGPASALAFPSLSIFMGHSQDHSMSSIEVMCSTSALQYWIMLPVRAIHTCAKDMQCASSSKLPTVGEALCPFRLGNVIPSKTNNRNV